jgi:hypothetical protein
MAEDWVPTTKAGKRAMFFNVGTKIASHATELDLSGGEVSRIQKLCDEFVKIVDFQDAEQAQGSAVNAWAETAMTGKGGTIGDPLTDPPAGATFGNDPTNYIVGIIPEFRRTRDGWTTKSGWTQAIGEDLMVVKTDGATLPVELVTPTITARGAQSDYLISVIVRDREGAKMFVVETRQKGGDWQDAGTYEGGSIDITITPLHDGDPEQVEVRVRLKKGNQFYGNYSQTATVTVNP